jgi:hypothetical protein
MRYPLTLSRHEPCENVAHEGVPITVFIAEVMHCFCDRSAIGALKPVEAR